jgi:hypothetical protein
MSQAGRQQKVARLEISLFLWPKRQQWKGNFELLAAYAPLPVCLWLRVSHPLPAQSMHRVATDESGFPVPLQAEHSVAG